MLDIGGLDEVWDNSVLVKVRSDWTGDLGNHDFDGVASDMSNAIARLSINLNPRTNSSGTGPGRSAVARPKLTVTCVVSRARSKAPATSA